jgi:hypothetical protein
MPNMDDQEALARARQDAREAKSPATQAGEFVREEIDHVREGKHGAASVKQAIAIGLSKARRDLRKGKSPHRKVSRTRSRATLRALQQQGTGSVSPRALSQQARSSARRRGATARHKAAEKTVRTKGKAGLRAAARKAARTRQRRRAA